MYNIIKIVIILFVLVGVLYLYKLNKNYQNDGTSTKEEIVKYFKEKGAINIETGIKTKDLPSNILKNKYLLLMVKDKTLSFEKGKYYLNDDCK